MKCLLGHAYFPCRNCLWSRVFDRFAARVSRALDRAQFRRHFLEFQRLRSTYLQFSSKDEWHVAAQGGASLDGGGQRTR